MSESSFERQLSIKAGRPRAGSAASAVAVAVVTEVDLELPLRVMTLKAAPARGILKPCDHHPNSLGYWVDSENRRCNFTGSDADTGANSLFSLWDEAVTTRQAVAIANDMWKTTDWMDEDAEVDPKGEDFC
jgi:hypothetical protein